MPSARVMARESLTSSLKRGGHSFSHGLLSASVSPVGDLLEEEREERGSQSLIFSVTSAEVSFLVRFSVSHWSGSTFQFSSTKALFPFFKACPWRGRAMRLPRPPEGRLSCMGIMRS